MRKAEQITLYALTRLQSSNLTAVARIDTGSFTEKDNGYSAGAGGGPASLTNRIAIDAASGTNVHWAAPVVRAGRPIAAHRRRHQQ